jgi:hypothetical protein
MPAEDNVVDRGNECLMELAHDAFKSNQALCSRFLKTHRLLRKTGAHFCARCWRPKCGCRRLTKKALARRGPIAGRRQRPRNPTAKLTHAESASRVATVFVTTSTIAAVAPNRLKKVAALRAKFATSGPANLPRATSSLASCAGDHEEIKAPTHLATYPLCNNRGKRLALHVICVVANRPLTYNNAIQLFRMDFYLPARSPRTT